MIRDDSDTPFEPLLGSAPELDDEDPMVLVYLDDKSEKQRFELAGRTRTTIGRDAACDLVLADRRVSRVHATIELVHGQHLLRDNASSNGTFLNGLRLNSSHAFALRGSDTIEIGSERLRYVRADASSDPPTTAPLDGGAESFEAEALVAEASGTLAAATRGRIQTSLLAAFAGAPAARGIQAALPIVARELNARAVAAFHDDARVGVRVMAAVPAFESASALVALAQRCARDRKVHVMHGLVPIDPERLTETCVQDATSSAAAPLFDGERHRGVVAVHRIGGGRLGRAEAGLLALLAEAIARTLALKDSAATGETRT